MLFSLRIFVAVIIIRPNAAYKLRFNFLLQTGPEDFVL